MKGLGRNNHVLNTTSLICCLKLQLFQTDEAFKVNGRKHTYTLPSDNTLRFRKNMLEEVQKVVMTIDEKIREEKL